MAFPKVWLSVLSALQDHGMAEAAIAGGAIRDHLLNRPVKDVDIFAEHRGTERNLELLREAMGDAWAVKRVAGELEFIYARTMPEVAEVYDFWKRSGSDDDIFTIQQDWKYQVVFLNPPHVGIENVLDRFDIGLCKVGITLEHKPIAFTMDFMWDFSNQRITIVKPLEGSAMEAARDHATRIQTKYAGWPIFERPHR